MISEFGGIRRIKHVANSMLSVQVAKTMACGMLALHIVEIKRRNSITASGLQ